MIFYHGTNKKENAIGILDKGYLDPTSTDLKYGDRNPVSKPITDRVYVTKNLEYAVIYALGGVYMGSELDQSRYEGSRYGYVFTIEDKDFSDDILADEDCIGEIIAHCYMLKNDNESYMKAYDIGVDDLRSPQLIKLIRLFEKYSTDIQYKKFTSGNTDYIDYIRIGKKLNKYIDKDLTNFLIKSGAHVAHKGRLPILECYEFDKSRCSELKKDGSNFLQLSKKVTTITESNISFRNFLISGNV